MSNGQFDGKNQLFWKQFAEEAEQLFTCMKSGDLRGAFNKVEYLLQQNNFDLAFEMTIKDDYAVLALTPEGDSNLAKLIDELLEDHPKIPYWIIYGRRQRKPLPDAFVFVEHIYGEDLRNAMFKVEEIKNEYIVTMYTKGIEGLAKDDLSGLLATFLDHALGEDIVMSIIKSMKVKALRQNIQKLLSPEEMVNTILS